MLDKFREIEKNLKALEKDSKYLFSLIIHEHNYHAHSLNQYHNIEDEQLFKYHMIAYLKLSDILAKTKKDIGYHAIDLVYCKHDLSNYIELINSEINSEINLYKE